MGCASSGGDLSLADLARCRPHSLGANFLQPRQLTTRQAHCVLPASAPFGEHPHLLRSALVSNGGAVILLLLLQESGEVVKAEPGVQEHLTVVLGDPAPQLGVDQTLALARLR